MQNRGGQTAIFIHTHPYQIFIPEQTTRVIVGTLPPPRFSTGELRKRDVDFCYGSCDGTLWKALDAIFRLSLRYDNSREAVRQRKDFLVREKLGICDIVESCLRTKVDSSDLGMQDIKMRNIIGQLQRYPTITTLLFAGGNSKNGPEYLFRRQLKTYSMSLECVRKEAPRVHRLALGDRTISTFSLISPSNAANRSIGAHPLYKKRKKNNPAYSTFDFRVEQYRKVFCGR